MKLFLIGVMTGLVCATLGGVLQWRMSRGGSGVRSSAAPSLMVLVAGGLGLGGAAALAVSWILTGGIGPALWVGFGVAAGFVLGFSALFLGALARE